MHNFFFFFLNCFFTACFLKCNKWNKLSAINWLQISIFIEWFFFCHIKFAHFPWKAFFISSSTKKIIICVMDERKKFFEKNHRKEVHVHIFLSSTQHDVKCWFNWMPASNLLLNNFFCCSAWGDYFIKRGCLWDKYSRAHPGLFCINFRVLFIEFLRVKL